MKLLFLKVLLQRRARDEGFTLPMVIALGLVMLLLGTTNIVKSSEENLNAITQNSSSDALAIAEIGITKYRELLNQNRVLTVYNHNQWDDADTDAAGDVFNNVSTQACIDMTTAPPGWTGTATKPNDTAATATDASTTNNDNWWNVIEDIDKDGTDETIGEYRLVSYEYDIDGNTGDPDNNNIIDDVDDNGVFNVSVDANPNDDNDPPIPPSGVTVNSITEENDTDDDGESDAVGILTVQGRSTDGSEAQIQVTIPLRINQDDMENLAPALWIGTNDSTYLGILSTNLGGANLDVNGNNIVLVDGASSGSAGCADPADIGTNSVISDGRQVPSIAAIASKITEADGVSINTALSTVLGKPTDNPYVTPTDGQPFNKDNHCNLISNCRYYYKLDGTQNINAATETDGIAKVTLYVNGNLNINQDIGSSISSSYLEIYVTSAGKVTINSDSVSEINALIHAPDSELEITGSGNVDINSSVWVDKFINTSGATVNIDPDMTRISSRASVPSYELYTTTANRVPRPLTSAPINWVKEEVE